MSVRYQVKAGGSLRVPDAPATLDKVSGPLWHQYSIHGIGVLALDLLRGMLAPRGGRACPTAEKPLRRCSGRREPNEDDSNVNGFLRSVARVGDDTCHLEEGTKGRPSRTMFKHHLTSLRNSTLSHAVRVQGPAQQHGAAVSCVTVPICLAERQADHAAQMVA